ncbi:Ubiquitin carboxyl-terminal hydrolase 9 [Frankliniella fusca]|uniref:Ubiquitin carboxyl-terminal hydrolase 9 n=1 Tax=Frankliniella fusca TaxID=407009 RepID=A0AAE1H5Q7_9NEOP|nr:Ubiquitin carboxyl-terminal hydrolase 9 [Frankliniella fusca]
MDSEDEDDARNDVMAKHLRKKGTQNPCNPPRGGLVNRSTNGYACAVFELLFSLPPFVEWLGKGKSNMGSVRQSLADMYNMQCLKQLVDPEPIISRIGCYEADDHFGDAHLFFCDVILTLYLEEESDGLCDIRDIFCGVIKVIDKCAGCHTSSEENHLNLAYPIHLERNSSIQQGINEYNSPQIITCDKCQGSLEISQMITFAPNILSLNVQDIVGAPNIDLTVKFGGCSYELTGLIIKQCSHFQTISKCGSYWFQYKDASAQSIKVGQLLLNHDIKANLHLAVYCKVFDLNNNNHDNTATDIILQESVDEAFLAAGNECDTAKIASTESKELIEDFTFLFHEDVVEESVDPQNVKSVVWSPKTRKDLTAQLAVAEVFTTLDNFDPLLTETDVEGAVLPYPVDDSFSLKQLTRWLKCRGASTAKMSKAEMIKRIREASLHFYP